MVFTHLPSNLFLILTPFMPNLPLAIALLLARSALSQMDVPTRNSYVMAVVTPAERPAAASVTSVPRSLATAASPLLSGYLLGLHRFGWPLVIGGALKGIYDLAARDVRRGAPAGGAGAAAAHAVIPSSRSRVRAHSVAGGTSPRERGSTRRNLSTNAGSLPTRGGAGRS